MCVLLASGKRARGWRLTEIASRLAYSQRDTVKTPGGNRTGAELRMKQQVKQPFPSHQRNANSFPGVPDLVPAMRDSPVPNVCDCVVPVRASPVPLEDGDHAPHWSPSSGGGVDCILTLITPVLLRGIGR